MCKWVEKQARRGRREELYESLIQSREMTGGVELCYSSPVLFMGGGSSKLTAEAYLSE